MFLRMVKASRSIALDLVGGSSKLKGPVLGSWFEAQGLMLEKVLGIAFFDGNALLQRLVGDGTSSLL